MEKKVYTKELKLGAARMVVDEGLKASVVARDLGVAGSSVTKWVRDYRKHGVGAFPGKGLLAPADDELRRLQRELRQAQMERDLLKKNDRVLRGTRPERYVAMKAAEKEFPVDFMCLVFGVSKSGYAQNGDDLPRGFPLPQ